MKYVIIGNGVAQAAAIQGIREHDKSGEILVLTEEPVQTYGRPLISYYLAGKVAEDKLWYRPESFYKKNKVEVKLSTRVASIDAKSKTVATEAGESISYDKLLLATGGAPFMVDVDGLDGPGVYTFTTLDDAKRLMKKLDAGGKKAAIIGAGLIALKAAEGLVARGVDTTLVVRSRIMRVYFDEPAGEIIVDHLKDKGLGFAQGHTPQQIVRDDSGNVTGLKTDKGLVDCDMVIMAAGVAPRKELAEAAGLKTAKGILVGDELQTSDPDVFAAGDVAQAKDFYTGEPTVLPIWPNAFSQGQCAGRNMAGAGEEFAGALSMNSVAYFGLPTQSVGLVNPPEDDDSFDIFIEEDRKERTYRKLVFKGDKLVGYVLIGDIDSSGVYTSFVKFGFTVDQESRDKLVGGEPNVLMWPEDFFAEAFNPKA